MNYASHVLSCMHVATNVINYTKLHFKALLNSQSGALS